MNVFAASTQGAHHIKRNKPCQDFARCYQDEHISIAAVADGHGSSTCFRSERGSQFAVECALECIKKYAHAHFGSAAASGTILFDGFGNFNALLCALETDIHQMWQQRVMDDWNDDVPDVTKLDLDEDDYDILLQPNVIYGTTLVAVCAAEAFWFAVQIGDGKCVTLSGDKGHDVPVPDDENCRFNITTSLCEPDAPDYFRHYYSAKFPDAVFIATDGVDKSYPLEDNDEHLEKLYRTILENFRREGFEEGEKQLRDFLPAFTERGSGDDVSIAGILF